jgi:hypothetical protein
MAKYSKNLCNEIQQICTSKKKSDFEKCDDIFMLVKEGFFGKELIEQYSDEYDIIKHILMELKIPNSQWLATRCIDRFIRQGKMHIVTDNILKTTLGIDIPKGLIEQIKSKIKLRKSDEYNTFLTQAHQKFGEYTFDYNQGFYHNNDTNMMMICKKCETQFMQTPKRHLTSRFPCFQCVLYSKGYDANDEKTDHWSRVIPGLYIGDLYASVDQQFIYSKSIRYVVDLANGSQSKLLIKPISVYKINIDDSPTSSLKPYFSQSYNFMLDAMNKNQNILVFCRAGMSRSAAIVIYFLMKRYNISYYDGYRFVKSKRTLIEPNEGFVEQLLSEEENILQSQLV